MLPGIFIGSEEVAVCGPAGTGIEWYAQHHLVSGKLAGLAPIGGAVHGKIVAAVALAVSAVVSHDIDVIHCLENGIAVRRRIVIDIAVSGCAA